MNTLRNHPYKYTLDLLKMTIDRMPATTPAEVVQRANAMLEKFTADPAVLQEAILDEIAVAGRESWAYRKAYEELYQKYGKAKEWSVFFEELPLDVREKFVAWTEAGHVLGAPKDEASFEQAFAPDEKFTIEEVTLSVAETARHALDEAIRGEKAGEYAERLAAWEARRLVVDAKIQELRKMASGSQSYAAQLLEKVRLYEEGWSAVEKDVTVEELDRELEYWRGVLDVEIMQNEGGA